MKGKPKEDEQLDRAFQLLEKAASSGSATKPLHESMVMDKHTTFALHIAEKLRAYSATTVSYVQYEINKILFAADVGHFEKPPGIAQIPHTYDVQLSASHLYSSQPVQPPTSLKRVSARYTIFV